MRNLKYLALVLVLVLSIALPLSGAYAASPSQAGGGSQTSANHDGGPGYGLARSQHFTPLTGDLRSVGAGNKRYAIVVGSNYSSVPDSTVIAPFVPPFSPHLNWAAADANAMAGLLGSFGFDSVTALVGAGPTGASRANILSAIQTVKSQAKQGDEVVFYFSGHGTQQTSSDGGQRNGVASAGIVTDEGSSVNYLWDNDLAEAFSGFATNRIVFIFDDCLSGGMTELAGPGRLVLAATTSDGISAEDAAPGAPSYLGVDHGFFTFFLMAALTGNAPEADALAGAVMGRSIRNPYEPTVGATSVSMEQAFDYASYELQAVSPLVRAGLAAYYGHRMAANWGTPTIIDGFKGDLVL